jgi:hypothetical protein
MALHMITGAVVAALLGSFLSGIALAAGWLHMPWARAFALGVYGGAAIGALLGAAIAALRPRELEIRRPSSSRRRRVPAARYRSA